MKRKKKERKKEGRMGRERQERKEKRDTIRIGFVLTKTVEQFIQVR